VPEQEGRVHRTRAEIAATAYSPEERAERARASSRAYAATHREECRAYGRKYQIARREERLAEYLAANPDIREYRCKSQEEFDAIRFSMQPWLRFAGGHEAIPLEV
jgi:hypothetical protein